MAALEANLRMNTLTVYFPNDTDPHTVVAAYTKVSTDSRWIELKDTQHRVVATYNSDYTLAVVNHNPDVVFTTD